MIQKFYKFNDFAAHATNVPRRVPHDRSRYGARGGAQVRRYEYVASSVMFSRRSRMLGSATALLVGLAGAAPAAPKPNFVVLFVDVRAHGPIHSVA